MKCPFRKNTLITKETQTENDIAYSTQHETDIFEECYGTICPWYVSEKTNESIKIHEHCGQCK